MGVIIDISQFNTITDWSKVETSVDQVIIRMGYRGYGKSGKLVMDPKYKENVYECQKRGIPFGLYFFPTAISDKEAIEEADWVVANIPANMIYYYPVFADSEVAGPNRSGRSDRLSVAARTRFLRLFCERLQSKGVPAGVYASTSWLNNELDMSQLPFTVWVAQYNYKCTYSGNYLLWQYTSQGSVPGIKGKVDLNVLNESIFIPKVADDSDIVFIKPGDKGDLVIWIQNELNKLGYGLSVDGSYGDNTTNAILDFQNKRGITKNGNVNVETMRALLQ